MRSDLQQDVKKAISLLTSHEQNKSKREKFHDFLELAYCSFAKLTALTDELAESLELRYMKVVESYTDKDFIREAVPLILALTHYHVAENYDDFLGMLAGEAEMLNADQGQFFTPSEVSGLMAALALMDKLYLFFRDAFEVELPAPKPSPMDVADAAVDEAREKAIRAYAKHKQLKEVYGAGGEEHQRLISEALEELQLADAAFQVAIEESIKPASETSEAAFDREQAQLFDLCLILAGVSIWGGTK